MATKTETGYPLEMAAPDVKIIPANPEASCVYMKMITLEDLRDALRDFKYEVRVPADITERARVPDRPNSSCRLRRPSAPALWQSLSISS